MTLDGASIEVVKWADYNPRTDSKVPSWFRMENTMATGPALHDLDCEQKWLWVVILSLVSQENGDHITWKCSYIQAITGIKPKKQAETVEFFEQSGRLRVSRKVTLRGSQGNLRDSPATNERTNERTDERDGRTEGDLASPALPRLAEIWNRKSGNLAKVRGCSGTRRKLAEARWRENPDADYWLGVVNRIVRSPFCSGRNDRGWKADFDFFVRPETQHKVLEGKYDAVETGANGHAVDPKVLELRRQMEALDAQEGSQA